MSTKRKKRGVGRPKLEPMSGPELREKARAGIRRTTERQLKRNEIDVPTFVEEVEAVTGKHKFTRAEMDELRRKVDMIYNEYVLEKWESEAEANEPYIDPLRAAVIDSGKSLDGMMSREEWNLAHGLRADGSKRRGPKPKKKKTVFDLSPGERGTAEKPGEPISYEEMEQQLEAKLMDEYIKEREAQPQHSVGKRLRKDHLTPPKRPGIKSFWV